MSPHPRPLSARMSWWWLPVFLGLLAGYAVLVLVLVRDGIPVVLALTVPPAILGAAASTVVFLKNFLGSATTSAVPEPRPAVETGPETAAGTGAERETAGS
ncbi:hypothetical protein [Amycolatopsis regifaucium]|uniref:Uncharacterized protein n=1 Tax=Amycolatopsis regifaucium TaxID=546365 RepID=A0A154M4S2_9PSEU|nr:hypothetical protein [Amycolatopsis regifaucium]KZB79631.1 hypothetical protein AVL48_14540 [Amycolatopsis regifaucium]OKA10052.1 hypothetical protein ATP06_0206875 [Amycolatopsis regifaucium]SFI63279.1 hypothetical protein SAMN04489731_11210 [Amycolatopsis regifaucium]